VTAKLVVKTHIEGFEGTLQFLVYEEIKTCDVFHYRLYGPPGLCDLHKRCFYIIISLMAEKTA